MAGSPPGTGYVQTNDLHMYYEIHGSGGTPLVLLHGAFSAIGTSFEQLLPGLSANRQVVAFELQGHGRTADIDRPMSLEAMADDVAAALGQLNIAQADVLGYSMGAGVALHLVLRHPGVVRKLVLISVTYRMDGLHPGLIEGLGNMTPDMMVGSPWHDEYLRIAPRPGDFARLFAKKTAMDQGTQDIPAAAIRAIAAPVLLIIGDSDIIRPEHAVEMFRLLGGGVAGDMAGLPRSQLAILPGTTHVTAVARTESADPDHRAVSRRARAAAASRCNPSSSLSCGYTVSIGPASPAARPATAIRARAYCAALFALCERRGRGQITRYASTLRSMCRLVAAASISHTIGGM